MTAISLSPRRSVTLGIVLVMMAGIIAPGSALANTDPPRTGNKITGKSVGAGLLSLLIWPGIGQAVNNNPGKKVGWHAVFGLVPPYRLWSGYDALVDRKGGYWDGRV